MDTKAPTRSPPEPQPYTPSVNSDNAPPLLPQAPASRPRAKAGPSKPARRSPRQTKRKSPPKQKQSQFKGSSHKNYKRPSSSTSPSPSPRPSPSKAPPSDYKPKYKAEFVIKLKRERVGKKRESIQVVGDTGCSKSAISEEFFRDSPHLQTRPYRPLTTRGTAINGSKVLTLGIVNIAFRINGRFYQQNFRVVRGLV